MLIFLPVPPVDPLVDAPPSSTGPESRAGTAASFAPPGGTSLGACLVTPSGYQGTASPLGSHRDRGTVDAENLAQHAAHLADRRLRGERAAHQGQQIVGSLRTRAQGLQRAL